MTLLTAPAPADARETQVLLRVSVVVPPPPCAVRPPMGSAWHATPPDRAVEVSCAQPVPLVVSSSARGSALVMAGPQRRALPVMAHPAQGKAGGTLLLIY